MVFINCNEKQCHLLLLNTALQKSNSDSTLLGSSWAGRVKGTDATQPLIGFNPNSSACMDFYTTWKWEVVKKFSGLLKSSCLSHIHTRVSYFTLRFFFQDKKFPILKFSNYIASPDKLTRNSISSSRGTGLAKFIKCLLISWTMEMSALALPCWNGSRSLVSTGSIIFLISITTSSSP